MSLSIWIDRDIVYRMASIIRGYVGKLPKLDLFDKRFYPPDNSDLERVYMFFLVMVALDHRLSRPGKPYRYCFSNGECYRGADLLYHLGMRLYFEKPEFYTPEYLSRITTSEFKEFFNIGDAVVPDPGVRAWLLRDIGYKLLRLYNGSIMYLLESANGRIRGESIDKPGLIDLLRVFRAYEDPVEKKSYLLIKFLVLRGLFKPVDPWNMELPIDNHLTRIAFRTGLVRLEGRLWSLVREFKPVEYIDDVLIRLVVRRAYKLVSIGAGIDPMLLDDALWIYGRSVCIRDESPECSKCIFNSFCLAYHNREYMVSEHNYYSTWYY